MSRRFATITDAARYRASKGLTGSPDTIRNWIKRGIVPAYRLAGSRGLLVDLDEMDRVLRDQPPARVRRKYGSYGPHARITPLDPASAGREAAQQLPALSDDQAARVSRLLGSTGSGQ